MVNVEAHSPVIRLSLKVKCAVVQARSAGSLRMRRSVGSVPGEPHSAATPSRYTPTLNQLRDTLLTSSEWNIVPPYFDLEPQN